MDTKTQNKWGAAAWALPGSETLRAPFAVLAGEALDVVRFCRRHWEPRVDRDNRTVRPGLKSAVGNGTFQENIAEELLQLSQVFQNAQSRYQLLIVEDEPAPMERAQFVLAEIRSALDWYFDDGVTDVSDAQLDKLAAAHDGARSEDAVAAALFDYAELAERHRAGIDGLASFDAKLIDEARALATELREHSAGPATPEARSAQRNALELRNRLGQLLHERMQRIRAAARVVFRGRPELVRKATSAYFRRQRAAHRARARTEGPNRDQGSKVTAVSGTALGGAAE